MDLLDRVANRLKLRDLRLLDAVVRYRSMAKAAIHLNLSQPAVSKAISEMEQALGVRLLERSRLGIEPTPQGRALINRSAAIFDELRQGLKEIEYLSDPSTGEVRIAASEPMTAGLLPVILSQYSSSYPRVSIHVVQMPVASTQFRMSAYRELRERTVDLMLGPIVDPFVEPMFEAEEVFQERLTVTVGAKNRWLRRKSVKLIDLMEDDWILPPADSPVGVRITAAFRASGLAMPRRTLACVSLQLQSGMLSTQRFITVFPRSVVRFSGSRFGIRALPIKLPDPFTPIGIVTVRNRSLNPAAQRLIETVRQVTRPMAKER